MTLLRHNVATSTPWNKRHRQEGDNPKSPSLVSHVSADEAPQTERQKFPDRLAETPTKLRRLILTNYGKIKLEGTFTKTTPTGHPMS